MQDKNNNREKFLKDREFPGSQEISNYKNFDQVLKNHSLAKSILVKKIIIWSSVVLVVTTTALVTYMSQKNNSILSETIVSKEEAVINPPLPGKEIQFSSFLINASEGGEIKYNNTIIKIQPNSFLNTEGKVVADTIRFMYREFMNPLDIYLSGIPMTYDSSGVEYTFESAGMFELLAFKGNEKLVLDKKKTIEVKMPFAAEENYFNFYTLNDSSGRWDYIGKNVVKEEGQIAENNNIKKSDFTRDFTEQGTALLTPQKADPKKYSFNIEYDAKEFPELISYTNVLFEVIDAQKFSKDYYKINWDAIALNGTDIRGVFELRLTKADTSLYVDVKPVFKEKDYDAALKAFEKDQRDVAKKVMMEDIEKERKLNTVNNDINASSSKQALGAANRMMGAMDRFSVVRVSGLGRHNFDYPIPPSPLARTVKFIQNTDAARVAANKNIYLIEKRKNALFKFSEKEAIKYNPEAENLAWVMTGKNEFAFLDQSMLDKPEITISPDKVELVPEQEALKRIGEFVRF